MQVWQGRGLRLAAGAPGCSSKALALQSWTQEPGMASWGAVIIVRCSSGFKKGAGKKTVGLPLQRFASCGKRLRILGSGMSLFVAYE